MHGSRPGRRTWRPAARSRDEVNGTAEDARPLHLRRDGTCALCGIAQPRGTDALWSPSVRLVYCRPCAGGAVLALSSAGTAGGGAAQIYENRQAADSAKVRARWGRIAPLVEALSGPKQTTQAWAKGADGEERLGSFLERELTGEAIVIHDRRMPGRKANIDHIAVGPSGVWVIDAKNYTGRVERRDVGGLFRTDFKVFVGGRDQTKLVAEMAPQVAAVAAVLQEVSAFAELPLRGALCFTSSNWGLLNLGKPFAIEEVLVTYPGGLRDAIRKSADLTPETIGRVAARIADQLRPA